MADGIGYNDMMRMQSEAVQRVQEMQRRARNAVQRANAQRAGRAQEHQHPKEDAPKAPPIQHSAKSTALPLDYLPPPSETPDFTRKPPPHEGEKDDAPTKESKQKPQSPSKGTDTDKLLVVALILLLSQEEADELLLMALGYLIM